MTIAPARSSRREPVTLQPSFSFYVTPSNVSRLRTAATFGDALTIAGPKGPATVRRLRPQGLDVPTLFDGMGYAGNELAPEVWVADQRAANADRVILPGIFVSWAKTETASMSSAVLEQSRIASDLDATVLLALDARWIARRASDLVDVLSEVRCPIALVLAHGGDPLSLNGAVEGLRHLVRRVPRLSLLRTDHGGVGALAFGAAHASMGLTTTTRHFAASDMAPRRIIDNSSRVFVRSLLDWYRAAEIAGWSAAGTDFSCRLPCCLGATLSRYLDPDLDVTFHNMTAMADFADYILNADPSDRSRIYLEHCRAAIARYGLAGFNGPEKSKAQLNSWAFS